MNEEQIKKLELIEQTIYKYVPKLIAHLIVSSIEELIDDIKMGR